MTNGDTSIGGKAAAFPDTQWSLVRRFQSPDDPDYRAGMAALAQRYWKPAYAYVRIGMARTNEDAKDLTQAFFMWLLEGNALKTYDAEKGSFRTFLKVLLRRFAGHEREARERLRRGGGHAILSLDAVDLPVDPKAVDPEQAFEQAWLNTLMKHAVDRVRERFHGEGREIQFQVFETYDLAPPGERPTYPTTAARLNVKETDISNHLHAVRSALCVELRRELAQLTADEADLQAEWNVLFGS